MILPSETYSEPSQTSKMKDLVKIVKGFQSLTIFAGNSRVLNTSLALQNCEKLESNHQFLRILIFFTLHNVAPTWS